MRPGESSVRAGSLVFLAPIDADPLAGRNTLRAPVARDGTFTIPAVPVGTHLLVFNGIDGWARERIEVRSRAEGAAGTAGTIVELEPRPYMTVRGRLELHSAGQVAGSPSSITVTLRPVPLVAGSPLLRAQVAASGEFTISRVPAAAYTFSLAPSAGWEAVSATIGNRDTLDSPVEITTDVDDVVIVASNRRTAVRGRVRDARGEPVISGSVVVISENRAHWTPGGSRRVRVLPISPDGSYAVTGLPPGRYRVAAVPRGTPVNNARLVVLLGEAGAFDLAIGESKVVDAVLR